MSTKNNMEFNVFNVLRGETPEDVKKQKLVDDLQRAVSKCDKEQLKLLQEEILVELLVRVEDAVNAFILTAKQGNMGLETPEDYKATAKRVEKQIAFSEQYGKDTPEVREHLKTYLNNVLQLIIASFNSHKHN